MWDLTLCLALLDADFYDPTRHLWFHGFLAVLCITPLVVVKLPLGYDFNLGIFGIIWFRFVHKYLPFLRVGILRSMLPVIWIFCTPLLFSASAFVGIIAFAGGLAPLNESCTAFLWVVPCASPLSPSVILCHALARGRRRGLSLEDA